jgi:hypothetical protein
VELLTIGIAVLAALVVPAIVMDVKARRRGRRIDVTGDGSDVYRQHPTAPITPPTGPVQDPSVGFGGF